jgi:hypothetical protein
MTPDPLHDPDLLDEVWGLIAFLIVAAFLGDLAAGAVALAILVRRLR